MSPRVRLTSELAPAVQDPPTGGPLGWWAVTGVTLTATGGPLALAALYAPDAAATVGSASLLVEVLAAAVFLIPLTIWFRFSRHVSSGAGLAAFVEASIGVSWARVQAALWITSYLLYLLATTAQVVYGLLPEVLPRVGPYQPLLETLLPAALTAIILAGRKATLIVAGTLGFGQLALTVWLDVIAVHQLGFPLAAATPRAASTIAAPSASTALLYICASLPFFLGGETTRRTLRRAVGAGVGAVYVVVGIAVVSLSAGGTLIDSDIPGMTLALLTEGRSSALIVGIGVAASVSGVMLIEYLALTRLITAMTGWKRGPLALGIGAVTVGASSIGILDPDEFYDTLLRVSLVALWLSQLVVFASFPWFARRFGPRPLIAWPLSVAACAFSSYGLWVSVTTFGS